MQRYTVLIITLLSLPVILIGLACTNASAASPNISRSYYSTTSIPVGSIVSLVSNKSGYVELSNIANGQKLAGVAVNSDESLLAVNPTSGKVQIATDGNANTLVSTVNGNIIAGQEIAVSPFNGIGMLASPGDRVVGTALTNFSSNTSGAAVEKVKDSSGTDHNIIVGYVKLSISIGVANNTGNSSLQAIQQFIEGLTGHYISTFRVVVVLGIAFLVIISMVTLIYAAVYSSIISIGRNPLAKFAVLRTLTYVISMVGLIAGVGSLSLYLLVY
jgi:hypothetical protein